MSHDIKDIAQVELAKMYAAKQRPVCSCQTPGIEMYIAKINNNFVVKRMPNTGSLHAPECDSYEPPPELSGLGDVLGTAIKENEEDGITELRFGFSMTKVPGRDKKNETSDSDSIKSDGSKLTLRSILDYLWEQAGFNKWTPAMEGKRTWSVIHKHLLAAADGKIAKGAPLTEKLYIPEPFYVDRKQEINQRRMTKLAKIATKGSGARQLMVLIGEVKELAISRYGHKLIVKHAGDCPFMMNDEVYKKLTKKYESDLGLWETFEDEVRLVTIATFSVGQNGIANIEEISLMTTNMNWIPFEHVFDKAIIEVLTEQKRRFTKCMRYNLKKDKPLASVVLSDTKPQPTAMYVFLNEAGEVFQTAMDTLIEESHLNSWVWHTSEYVLPELPPVGE